MIFYKIRQKDSSLFSNKAYEFKKIGSFWTNKNDLQHHLKMIHILMNKQFADNYLDNIEIVEFEMTEIQTLPLEDINGI